MFFQPAGPTAAWLYLFVACAVSNAANLILAAANQKTGMSVEAIVSVPFAISLGLYGMSFILYSRSLSRIPLSIAYPIFVGISLLFVSVASFVWLEYPMTTPQLGGLVFILLGVILVSLSSRSPARSSETT